MGAGGGWKIIPSSYNGRDREKTCVLSINIFFTIVSHNRDLDALLPGNGSELRHASFCF